MAPTWKAEVPLTADGLEVDMGDIPFEERRNIFIGQAIGLCGAIDEEYPNEVALIMDTTEFSESTPHGVNIRFEPTPTSKGKHGIKAPTLLCPFCVCIPCLASCLDNGTEVHSLMEELAADGRSNREIRFSVYRKVARDLYGVLGSGIRVKLPNCIIDTVQNKYPNENGEEYVGFLPATGHM